MLFNSVPFLIFFPAVLLVHFALPLRVRYLWLLVASYFFYMCWNPAYALLMLCSTAVTYASGLLITWARRTNAEGQRTPFWRSPKGFVAMSFVINLGILFFFKYFTFAAQSLVTALGWLGVSWEAPALDLLLPVGISFYTFQALSYTVDVYRDEVQAERNFLRYALFVSFFPQLVAGPIERSKNLLSELSAPKRFSVENFKSGALLMLWGYFQKMVIADRAAIVVNLLYGAPEGYAGYELWVATILFAVQIYCDFAGYSAIAIGGARMLGVNLMQNFRQPYLATSVSDFWRRWHISLSTWFRDYLYIPLGGNRKGAWRKAFNLMVTFLLSGLWHGANWTFVLWGGLNGLMQIVGDLKNRLLRRLPQTLRDGRPIIQRDCFSYRLFQRVLTFFLICVTWVFFRADSLPQAADILTRMFTANDPWIFFDGTLLTLGLTRLEWDILLLSIAALFAVDVAREHGVALGARLNAQNRLFRWGVYAAAVLFILLFGIYGVGYDASQFIYFQF